MVLWGSFVNAIAIIGGALLGAVVRFPNRIRQTIMNALGLVVMIIGISMGLESNNILIPIVALVIGSIIGETLNIEWGITKLGQALQEHMEHRNDQKGTTDFTQGFLTATLVYCVGAMAVVGGLNSGLSGDSSGPLCQVHVGRHLGDFFLGLLRHWRGFFGDSRLFVPRRNRTVGNICGPDPKSTCYSGTYGHRWYSYFGYRLEYVGVDQDHGR